MRLVQILDKIKQIHPDNLPGFEAQAKMSPPLRGKFSELDFKKRGAKESAVLILLYEKQEESYIVFTQRHEYNGAHSGQISFPGGKRDEEDLNLTETARRETLEEVGINIPHKNIVSPLTWLYVPPSNFVIYPYIGFLTEQPKFVKEEKEVKEILEFKVSDLSNKLNQKKYLYTNKQLKIQFESPSYQINDKNIWGATAMILSEFLSIIES